MKIVDHYLFCLPIGIDTTALSVFSKLDNYFSEHEVMWFKCKSVSTDGARAMVGVRSVCCCSHKASRTRGCEHLLHPTP